MLDVGGLGSLRIRDCFAEFTLSSKTLSVANGVANVLAMTSESPFVIARSGLCDEAITATQECRFS